MSTPGIGQPRGAVASTQSGTGEREFGRPPTQRTDSPVLPEDRAVHDLFVLGLTELREVRRDAQRDETDLSYVRRLLQGRIDILRAELARRLPRETPSLVAPAQVSVVERLGRSCGTPRPGTAPPPGMSRWGRRRARSTGGWRPRCSPRWSCPTWTPAPTGS
ncbi:hypothetical protein SHKM778_90810 [Streptomyces sp. KM77-8]|uniref:RsiG-like domain-containing protein n=1 Tax=Streptomyces haneummycinicus TaxID=3074435 RepID=A0AAT9HYV4_9ACTN